MFRYLQLFWYYPSFFVLLYIYTIIFQKKVKLVIIDQFYVNVKKITTKIFDNFNFQ